MKNWFNRVPTTVTQLIIDICTRKLKLMQSKATKLGRPFSFNILVLKTSVLSCLRLF